MLMPTRRRTVAPRGKTPVLPAWDRRDRISVISAVTVSPRRKKRNLYFHLLADNRNICAPDVVDFLRHLLRHIRRPITIVWDRSNTHDRSKAVWEWLAKQTKMRTERFPGYAPELNPDEQVWSNLKYARLSNYAPNNTRQLRRRLVRELQHLRRRPDLLASFIRHAQIHLRL